MGKQNTSVELPTKFKNHFNEMKELLNSIKPLGMGESEFLKEANKIGVKHFGHPGIVLSQEKDNTSIEEHK